MGHIVLIELNEGLNSSIGSTGSAAVLMQPPVSTQTVIRMERPPEVGSFDGNPADWPAFRDLFVAEVHNRDNIDPVSKLIYLQRALTGAAAKTLGPWKPTSENYAPAWKVMLEAYNDDYHVIHGILGKMFAVQKQERESHGALRTILDSLHGGRRQLETLADSTELLEQVWIHVSKQRLPRSTLGSWEQYRNNMGGNKIPSLKEFMDFFGYACERSSGIRRRCDKGCRTS